MPEVCSIILIIKSGLGFSTFVVLINKSEESWFEKKSGWRLRIGIGLFVLPSLYNVNRVGYKGYYVVELYKTALSWEEVRSSCVFY